MTDVERKLYKLLLAADVIAVVVSMVAGPLNRTAVALGAAGSAVMLSLCLLGYGLYFWPKRK